MLRRHAAALALALLPCAGAAGQAPPPAPAPPAAPATAPAAAAAVKIEAIPDPVKLPLAEVPYVHPLFRPVDEPARVLDRPAPADFNPRATLFCTLRLDESGKVGEGYAVQPPLAALGTAAAALIPKWRFAPAKRAGAPVATWATYGVELQIALEKGAWGTFSLLPVAKDQPLETVAKETPGEGWINTYPREVAPKDPAVVSIEDVDTLPLPDRTRWSFSSVKPRSHVTALVEVAASGAVRRLVPTGTVEPLVLAWVRQNAAQWKLAPARAGGKAVDSWMTLDAMLDYEVDDARELGKRSSKKNLRGTPLR